MNQDRLERLLQEYFDNTISKADAVELLRYLNNPENNISDVIQEEMLRLQNGPVFGGLQKGDVLQRIKSDPRFINQRANPQTNQPKVIKFYQSSWFKSVAAILFICLGLGLYIINIKNKTPVSALVQKPAKQPVILPGGNKATLTLANGQVIVLDTANNGLISNAGKESVVKSGKSQITYSSAKGSSSPASAGKNTAIAYNILSTPKGGVFKVVLPDGTRVWLNSASSLKFPTEFTGNERRVTLTGEAYFEAAKDKSKPFLLMLMISRSGFWVRTLI